MLIELIGGGGLLLSPLLNSWYFIWLLPVLAVIPGREEGIAYFAPNFLGIGYEVVSGLCRKLAIKSRRTNAPIVIPKLLII